MGDDVRAVELAALTPLQRLEWLEQTLELLSTTDAFAADRERRRQAAERFAQSAASTPAAPTAEP